MSGVIAEIEDPPALVIDHLLVVDDRAPEVPHLPEHGHVLGLTLDGVREEEIRLARLDEIERDLLQGQDDGTGRQSFIDRDAGQAVVVVREDPDLRGLDAELDGVVIGELAGVGRDQGGASLPLADVLSADPYLCLLYTSDAADE